MRRLVPVALAALAAFGGGATAHAQEMSSNVQRVATIPEMKSAIALAFIDNAMFVSTAAGIYSYDVGDPAKPKPVGALPMYIWENEDMDVDVARKRIFISRDPRGFTTPATPGAFFPYGAVHIIDVSDPSNMRQIGFFTTEAGHTTTCVNDCDVIWTAGPYANEETQPGWVGRPIFATDVTDPADPKPCPEPIDVQRNDGITDYVHDVQVDRRGVAWVSGAGGVRGYWTRGVHQNPVSLEFEEATGCRPIPFAGSGTPETATPSRFMHNSFRVPGRVGDRSGRSDLRRTAKSTTKKKSRSKRSRCSKKRTAKARRACVRQRRRAAARRESSRRGDPPRCRDAKGRARACNPDRKPPGCEKARGKAKGCDKPKPKPDAPDKAKPTPKPKPKPVDPPPPPESAYTLAERTLLATEENLTSDCKTSGRFVAYDLEGTFKGEGWRNIASTKHRMKVFDTWTPENAPGAEGCDSAHYFSARGDGITANSFYSQGVRFLDVSDPRDIRQIGWYRPDNANVWAPYWREDYVFVADFTRGVEILKFTGTKRSATVTAPLKDVAPSSELRFDRRYLGGLCPLPV